MPKAGGSRQLEMQQEATDDGSRGDSGNKAQGTLVATRTAHSGVLAFGAKPRANPIDSLTGTLTQGNALLHRGRQGAGQLGVVDQGVSSRSLLWHPGTPITLNRLDCQQAKSLELRVIISLSQLWQQ